MTPSKRDAPRRHAGEQRLEERDRAPLAPRGAERPGRLLDRVQALNREAEGLAKRRFHGGENGARGGAERRDGQHAQASRPACSATPAWLWLASGASGSVTSNVVPWPSVVRTSMWPPCDSTIP